MSFSRSLRLIPVFAVVALIAGVVALAVYQLSRQQAFLEVRAAGRQRLDLYSASLEREINKYAYFPTTLGLEREVLDLLDARLTGKVNRYLEELNQRAGTQSIFIMNRIGRVLASSDWQARDSLVGQDLSFRPYFRDAVKDGYGRFFGVGVTREEPGYFLSSALVNGDNVLGVATVKVGLEELEKSWSVAEASVFVSDENGVIILSSVPEWKFSTLRPIDGNARAAFDRSRQYGDLRLKPLGVREVGRLDEWTGVVNVARGKGKTASADPFGGEGAAPAPLPDEAAWMRAVRPDSGQAGQARAIRASVASVADTAFEVREIAGLAEKGGTVSLYPTSGQFLAQSRPLAGSNWTLTVYSSLAQVDSLSTIRAVVAGVTAVLLCIVTLMFNERRKHLRDRLAAREALQKAYGELERKVEERTLDLSMANRKLQGEVAERTRAERVLRAAQDELIQAGKLAVIGQISAGIVHELNQPLAALRTLSANTARFLERGDEATARFNLERIGQLVDRMGQITGDLRNFAKKSDGRLRLADMKEIAASAIALLGQRLRSSGAEVACRFPDAPARALCDPNRMEQVLVNLIGNALDAMAGEASPRVDIGVALRDRRIRLEVRDYGKGLADDVLPRLFEPFFTTKDAGLGLGLSISAEIVKDFGGTLAGANHPEGGAVFSLELPLAENDASP
ncbi:MAG: sensor histidine kinase [Candidatus Accumulibacter sp.]|jgi:two-component system C4-dicarboxylate transport sensor histidine kinase DctB|nr:sensor histidine kinase [Accumulibacter sp.]